MQAQVEELIQNGKMHPHHIAQIDPSRPAIVMAGLGLPPGQTPEVVTFKQLNERSNQIAHLFRAYGLRRGSVICIFMSNNSSYHCVAWAAQRAGLKFVCASSKLAVGELEYIVEDSGAKIVVASPDLQIVARQLAARLQWKPDMAFFMAKGATNKEEEEPEFPFKSLDAERAKYPTTPIADQSAGSSTPYSSGTTGKPKGIIRLPPKGAPEILPYDGPNSMANMGMNLFGWKPLESVYISPGPLYHSSPIGWTMGMQAIGGTTVIMERFDAEAVLRLIDQYKCTTGHFVATHFVRMLKLPEEVRRKYSLKSLVKIFHSAAPTPVLVKKAMIEWLGPIIQEFYGGSEGIGMVVAPCEDWLKHPGTCGKPYPPMIVHIWDEEKEVEITEPGKEGAVYFENGSRFEYNNDPVKTKEAMNKMGWTTLGDIGYKNSDGYLFLTDRKAFMIISGGVNIFPAEIENMLITHDKVRDVAVVGAPDADFGECVVAVVEPMRWSDASRALSEELKAWLRERMSHVKVPREITFTKELPRHDTGKLYKRIIKDAYHGKADASLKGVIPDEPGKL